MQSRCQTDLSSSPAVSASGATIRLADASELIDFESGGFGHGAAPIAAAVARQMALNPLATRHFLSLPLARFTARLAEVCPGGLEVSYLCNSRAEAVEGALKLAYGFHADRSRFVALEGAYHGSTLGALSVCGIDGMRGPFTHLPLAASFAADPDRVCDLIDRETAAVIVEPWPGGAGLPAPSAGWLRRVSSRCAEAGALLIADETRSGIGRTGAIFAVEHEGVVPDLLVLGGALGGGILPLAGYVTKRQINDRVYGRRDPTLHASATGGNPAACAAGIATLEMLDSEDLPSTVRSKGDHMLAALRELQREHPSSIADVRGVGLFGQVRLRDADHAGAAAAAALSRGLACGVDPSLPGLVLCPPLTVGHDELDRGHALLREAIASLPPVVRVAG